MIRYNDIYNEDFLNLFDKSIAKKIDNLALNKLTTVCLNRDTSQKKQYDYLQKLDTNENSNSK